MYVIGEQQSSVCMPLGNNTIMHVYHWETTKKCMYVIGEHQSNVCMSLMKQQINVCISLRKQQSNACISLGNNKVMYVCH